MTDNKLELLKFNATKKFYDVIEDCLSNPHYIQWPQNSAQISGVYCQLKKDLPSDYLHLLDTAIISFILLKKDTITDKFINWARSNLDWTEILSGITIDQALKANWESVRVAGVTAEQVRLTHYLIGAFDGQEQKPGGKICPDWFENCLSNDSRGAIEDGFKAACQTISQNTTFYTFALKRPAPDTVHGRSLALPMGIGARAAMTKSAIYGNMLATGDLVLTDGEFQVKQVQNIQAKYDTATSIPRSLFIYPFLNLNAPPETKTAKAIPVHSFEEGWMWASLYDPQNINKLKDLETALLSREDFIDKCDRLMPEHLRWAKKQPKIQDYLHDIRSDSNYVDLLNDLSTNLEHCSKNRKDNYDRLFSLTSLYEDTTEIDAMAKHDPATALLYCSSHLSLANHAGDNLSSEKWKTQGSLYQEEAQKTERGQRIFEEFINRALAVSNRHNQYDFHPDMPELYMSTLEKQEQINQLMDQPADYALGSMYGSIAQNYAFCGPGHLEKTRKYVCLAQKAFGNGKVPTRQRDWGIQNSYLYFALLDGGSGCESEAGNLLLSMLGKNSWNKAEQTLRLEDIKDYFLLFALTRGLVDIPSVFQKTTINCFEKQLWNLFQAKDFQSIENSPHSIHPWQLWCHNLGRLLISKGKQEEACQAWEKSVHLCGKGEETMKVMALLPLSCLQNAGKLGNEHENTAQSVLKLIQSSPTLNSKHFKDIVSSGNTEDGLRMVYEHPELFFPFNYR